MNSIKNSRRLQRIALVAAAIVALCDRTSSALGAEPASPRMSASRPAANSTRAPANWGTSRKLDWQPARKNAPEKNEPVRTVKYEEDVFDGPALQGKVTQAAAPMRLTQVPKSPFEQEEPKPTTPPPSPMPEPMPEPMLPTQTIQPPRYTPTPMPETTPPESNPPTTSPPSTNQTPTPTPTPDPLLDQPRAPATNPPGIFLEGPSTQFDTDFRQGPPPINSAKDCQDAYNRLKVNTIDKLSVKISVPGEPGDDMPYECTLTDQPFNARCWKLTTYTWKASALCHKPIYFEEEALERYGHSHGPGCEYLVSFAHFFGNVALLPYHMGVQTPCECVYTLGVYRAGSCAPYMIDPFPISLRGAAFGAVGYCGTVALFP
jgi:hypothetical protein